MRVSHLDRHTHARARLVSVTCVVLEGQGCKCIPEVYLMFDMAMERRSDFVGRSNRLYLCHLTVCAGKRERARVENY